MEKDVLFLDENADPEWVVAQIEKLKQTQTVRIAETPIYFSEGHFVIKVKLDDGAKMPTKAHDTDAGFDLYAPCDCIVPRMFPPDWVVENGLEHNNSVVIDTGVHIELPRNTVGMLKSKSGLNVKHGITSEGVIDVGYTGSIRVKLYNNGTEDYIVRKGDKISQLVILPIIPAVLEQVDELTETERGENGFGSSGK